LKVISSWMSHRP